MGDPAGLGVLLEWPAGVVVKYNTTTPMGVSPPKGGLRPYIKVFEGNSLTLNIRMNFELKLTRIGGKPQEVSTGKLEVASIAIAKAIYSDSNSGPSPLAPCLQPAYNDG